MKQKERNAVQISKERGLILPLDSSACLPQCYSPHRAVNYSSKQPFQAHTLHLYIHTLNWQRSAFTAAVDKKAKQKYFFLKFIEVLLGFMTFETC